MGICILLFLNSLSSAGQNSPSSRKSENSIYIDCATAVYIGTAALNYERTIISTKHYRINFSSGFGGWYFVSMPFEYYGFTVPLSLNNLVGRGNNLFEADIGFRHTFLSGRSEKDRFRYFPVFNLGYRFQRPDGRGLLFRSFAGLSGFGIGVGKLF